MAPQDTGAHAAGRKRGGRLLWLWLLLGTVALTLVVWAVAQLTDDGDELDETVPATAARALEAGDSYVQVVTSPASAGPRP